MCTLRSYSSVFTTTSNSPCPKSMWNGWSLRSYSVCHYSKWSTNCAGLCSELAECLKNRCLKTKLLPPVWLRVYLTSYTGWFTKKLKRITNLILTHKRSNSRNKLIFNKRQKKTWLRKILTWDCCRIKKMNVNYILMQRGREKKKLNWSN